MSSPTAKQRAQWRVFLETALALIDILDAEMQEQRGITIGWYDVLVHLEDAPEGLPMTEIASRILFSKSGLTRVIDRMQAAGLVRRERPPEDRRVVKVLLTPTGLDALNAARAVHRRGIQEHFVSHLNPTDLETLAESLQGVREHVRPLRPGRISR
jgi:DNA-binding MarR family transcriptional regulator